MKRILIYYKYLRVGGVTTVLYHYLSLLAQKESCQVDLLVIDQPNMSEREGIPDNINVHYILSDVEAEFEIFLYWKRIEEPDNHYFSAWYDGIKQRTKFRTLDFLNARQPYDIIINFNGNFDSFLQDYDLHSHTKVMRFVHANHDITNFKNDPVYFKNIFSKHHQFIAVSEDMGFTLQQLINGTAENEFNLNKDIQRIYNPVNLQATKDKMNGNSDPLLSDDYIVAVSGLYHGKGYQQMINIYHQLKQKGITQKLYIVGDGYLKEELEQKIKDLGMEQDCLLLGKKDNPFPYMKHAKLLIHTSESEGLPTVFIESMTCGTPVVSFNCPTGPREILADGKYGGLIPMGDNDKFVETVYTLLTDESKRQAYIDLLPEAIQRFDIDTIKPQIYQVIDTLLYKETA